jgi:hypothetical protein
VGALALVALLPALRVEANNCVGYSDARLVRSLGALKLVGRTCSLHPHYTSHSFDNVVLVPSIKYNETK